MFKKKLSQSERIGALVDQRDTALNIFVKTQEELGQINAHLSEEIDKSNEEIAKLTEEIEKRKAASEVCSKQKSSNAVTIEKIGSIFN